ncbi:hypothetical protein KPH14_011738 [Odynerus spinipes]|uniref:Amidase domain-containing protein n=1 Tax=Odynerus spinipes TaxID=1348599 RepID=A0AAD9VTQ4_9HYME|nr:hypothetical protein KPH14_011738 [Odynerus spinipes]
MFLDLRPNYMMLDTIVNCIVKVALTLLRCIMYPVIRIQIKKRQYCPPIRNEILLSSATELSQRIRRKEISSEEVISAFITRCKEVNPVVNAIVEDRFEAALQEAREIDLFLKTTTRNEEDIARGTPLLGLPITVKESIAVKGLSYAVGVKIEKNRKATDDADVVKRVRKAGGVPILVSNTPELCMFWESANNVTGKTLNPYDTRRTPGGSSGGEAALLSSGASLLSLASDVGGSARLPAMFCGVFGHKPSPNWVSSVGHRPNSTDNAWNTVFSVSPMARYAIDLPLLLKAISQSTECTERLNQEVDLRHVKFFYVEDIDSSPLTSTVGFEIKLAIHNLVKHVETTYGSSIQKVNLKDLKYAIKMSSISLLELNKVETVFNLGDGTKPWKNFFIILFQRLCFLSSHTWPPIMYGILKKLYQLLPKSYKENMQTKHDGLRKELKEILGNDGVLIYPSFCSVAHYHFETYYKLLDVCYLLIFNTLSLPATQCTMGLNKNGLPVGLQVIANNGCDHLSLAVAKEVERRFGGWQQPPSSSETT